MADYEVSTTDTVDGAQIHVRQTTSTWKLFGPNKNVGSWIGFLFVLFMTTGCTGVGIAALLVAAHRFLHTPTRIDVMLFVATGLFPAALFLLGAWFFTIELIKTLFPRHLIITVDRFNIRQISRHGPYRRFRALHAETLRQVTIRATQTSTQRSLNLPLDERPARVLIEPDALTEWAIEGNYPHAVAMQIGEAIMSLFRRTGGQSVPIVDTMDPRFVDADVTSPPAELGLDLMIEQTPQGTRIAFRRTPMTFGSLLAMPNFRVGLWSILLPPLFIYVMALLLPDFAQILFQMMPGATIICSMLGGPLLLAVFYERLFYREYLVTDRFLQLSTNHVLWRWRTKWPREQIGAIRLAKRIGNENRCLDVIELVRTDGERVVLQSGGLDAIRFLAAALRQALDVPANNAALPGQPDEPEWHRRDDLTEPPNWPYIVTRNADGFVALKPAEGVRWWRTHAFVGAFSVVVLIGSVVGAYFIPLIEKPDDQQGACIAAAVFASIAILLPLIALYESRERHTLTVTGNAVTFFRQSPLGIKRRTWLIADLLAIGTEAQFEGNPKTDVRLTVTPHDGKPMRLLLGDAHVMRHLATLLRSETGLPTIAPPIAEPQMLLDSKT